MLVNKGLQLAILAVSLIWDSRTEAASTVVKICGRKLGEIMSRVCHVYNSPSWDVPTVVEQPAAVVRRRRQAGIADECCNYGCTWEQFSEYCAISAISESPLDSMESHLIADRSAEAAAPSSPAIVGLVESAGGEGGTGGAGGAGGAGSAADGGAARREVGRGSRGYGRRCWCRRKRRSGRRRSSLMGNMDILKNAARAAPVVGTVSPLLTWGRTLNTDLPSVERDRYAYVAVYA